MTEDKTEEETIDEQKRAFHDEEERKQANDFKVGTRRTPLSNNILNLLGGLIQPQTEGFKQINLDMSFTYLDVWDIIYVKNSSFLITFCSIYGFKKSEYIERGNLATHLNARRSYKGKSMDLFTTTITKQDQSYVDKTEKKAGLLGGLGVSKDKK